jgi:FAD/FMN-containing dehydrogenase
VAGVGELGNLAGCGAASLGTDLRHLARQVSGPVVVPGEARYAQAKLLFNPSFDGNRPQAVAYCRTPEDVAATIGFARSRGIQFAARSGRHSFGGYSAPTGGLVADLSRMHQIQIAPDRQTAVLGPGAINIDMYSGLGRAGLALPGGTCPTVGLGGLVTGGGFGYSSRKLGLMVDNLLELELVTASGQRLTCNATEHPDLFWACRGGGGGNFGVVTSLRFRVHPVGDVSVFELAWRWSDAAAVIDVWQRWAPDAPDELFSTCDLGRAGGPRPSGPSITAHGQYFGSAARLAALLAPLEAAAHPTQRSVRTQTFLAAQYVWAGCAPGHCGGRAANPYTVKSAFFTDDLPAAGIKAAIEHLERWPGSAAANPSVGIQLNSWGGAIDRVPSSATAFVHRNARFLAIFGSTWSSQDSAARVAANQAWIERGYAQMRPYASGYAYQNLIDPRLSDWPHAYYGANLPRLTEVKRRYDPDDVFRFAQGIPV